MWQILRGRKPMSTRNTDIEKEQDASQGAPGTIFNEDTIQLEKASPPQNAPQPPKHTDRNRRNFWLAIAAVVIVLALIFSVFAIFIAQPGKQSSSQTTPTATLREPRLPRRLGTILHRPHHRVSPRDRRTVLQVSIQRRIGIPFWARRARMGKLRA